MHNETIERILSCEQLPSLPAVAARVIELTGDRDVNMKDLASTIQHDQALAAKVLRTINSSYFGLRNKCTTISQALVMLGLSAVKSLALGFSLVDTLKARRMDGFDYESYWRRGLYTGVGARAVARRLGEAWEDEAFLGGLLQDIGIVAMYQALGADYAEVVASGGHADLVGRELASFDVQHPEVGALLAARWKLPDELVLPIRYHERPTAAPGPVSDKVKAIALGAMMHDVLTMAQPVAALAVYEEHAKLWFDLDSAASMEVLRDMNGAVGDVVELFQLDAGEQANIEEILESAETQLVEVSRGPAGEEIPCDVSGVLVRAAFDDAVEATLERVTMSGDLMTILLLSIDGFERLRMQSFGAAEQALVGVAESIQEVAPADALCARYATDTFGLIAEGMSRAEAERLSASVRETLASRIGESELTVSVGIAAVGEGQGRLFKSASTLEASAMRALDAARMVGGDCERTFVPRKAA